MDRLAFTPIGVIHTPYQHLQDMPIQPAGAKGAVGTIVVEEAYAEGLADIEGFSHLILLYFFHASKGYELKVKPFLDDQIHGLFATRAPRRPNPIGLSIVPLLRREKNILHVDCIDVLDGTPLLDIKPFVPEFDAPAATATGWLEGKANLARRLRSDERFRE
ncbi:MAG: tRNA (N6-threonylcarbamoyladenosine(37)-N6)-methyltransferase TrmO [Desulfobacteraceae bacterium]|nr:tRNA (N6-threonylcarbamoyladenosine(37)-N6)-methyltransferase TrmO [Desulfobacteraceae bacterium]